MPSETNRDLTEPLLSAKGDVEEGAPPEQDDNVPCQIVTNENTETTTSGSENEAQPAGEFSVKAELLEMANLGIPLAISFFCRMGMASIDSAFVGHIHDGDNTPETYLSAAVLSDMVLSICVTPPLAFNQVLNSLVGQAMGSGNPKMAGIWLQQSMFWLSTSMLPCLVGLFYVEPILLLLGFSENVSKIAGIYAKYNLIWPIPNGLYQCMRFYFQAQGLPRPAMYNNIAFLFINALLNWIFVFGGGPLFPSWNGFGFIGAAISLSISRTMQGVVYFLYMFVYKKHHLKTWPENTNSSKCFSFLQHHTKARTLEFLKQALPNVGTLLFNSIVSQATTVLVGRLGELSIAASSALSTISTPWAGTLSATCTTISGVRVGYHLGTGNGSAAKRSANMVLYFITIVNIMIAFFFVPFAKYILNFATDDEEVLGMAVTLVLAMLVGTYLNLMVSNITSGVFSGMGRPLIATILSFGFEMPLSIGGVAIYIIFCHGNLLGVYWLGAITGAVELLLVFGIMAASNWEYWADEARRRQEASGSEEEDDEEDESDDDAETDSEEANAE